MSAAGRPARDDGAAVLEWLVSAALGDIAAEALFTGLCERLHAAGFPLLRAHLTMRTLHPMMRSVDLTWWRGRGLELVPRAHSPVPNDAWLQSPLYWMMQQRRSRYRQRLDDAAALARFAIFREFTAAGATDYLAVLTPFGDPATAIEREDGIVTSWSTDAAGGFTDDELALLERILPHVGLVAKLVRNEQTARNVLAAYLGTDAGARVLAGQIRLGDFERIPAVIWYSDLRDSTALAERLGAEAFVEALNEYFECTAGAVLEHGGEVLRFVGDAVLAVFPVTGDGAAAARRAYDAARAAQARLAATNGAREAHAQEALGFGLALHVGDVLYGNIGVPSRIEFSVIGATANEVCRMEGLTKALGEPVLLSLAFCAVLALPWRDLGSHRLKGVTRALQVFAPPPAAAH